LEKGFRPNIRGERKPWKETADSSSTTRVRKRGVQGGKEGGSWRKNLSGKGGAFSDNSLRRMARRRKSAGDQEGEREGKI